jgi:F-type H+-transporting ATPase subunit delta
MSRSSTVARRYAEAMADVALAHNVVDQIDGELHAFAEVVRQNKELREVFASPILSRQDKSRVAEAIIARTAPSQFTTNLLRAMASHNRLALIPRIFEQYRRIVNERRGVLVAEVTSAQPLAPNDQAQLGKKLEAMTGKKIEFQFKTDASLIGGVVTRIGSVVYDGSVRTQLQEIRQQLKSGV